MNDAFYLLIAGSRDFNDYDLLKKKCDYLLSNQNEKEIHIVSGGASAADKIEELMPLRDHIILQLFCSESIKKLSDLDYYKSEWNRYLK